MYYSHLLGIVMNDQESVGPVVPHSYVKVDCST